MHFQLAAEDGEGWSITTVGRRVNATANAIPTIHVTSFRGLRIGKFDVHNYIFDTQNSVITDKPKRSHSE
jgi:hypothetical protein